jgi:hypothetical protein
MRIFHSFEHLKQAPAFSVVAFGGKGPFSFEIDVIHERVTTLRGGGNALELPLHIFAISGVREHFWKRILQTRDKELRLEIDGVDEEMAQLIHWRRIMRPEKFGAGIPGAFFIVAQNLGQLGAASRDKRDQLGKTFLERAARIFWIPDEVPDAERGKIFSRIPGGEAGDGAAAFVLPNALADSFRVRL